MAESYVIRLLRRIGAAVFRKDDEFARQQGWEITEGRFGLSRTYRHPGFNELASCPVCRGIGSIAGTPCARCSGTGRVRLRRQVPADGGH